jgi:hypothetical protein
MASVWSPDSMRDIDVDELPHSYAYNTDGTLATDSITSGTTTWVKTYSYIEVNGQLLPGNKTEWVRQ